MNQMKKVLAIGLAMVMLFTTMSVGVSAASEVIAAPKLLECSITEDYALVQWARPSASFTGYQLQYSTSSTFKSGNKTITIAGAKNTSAKISGFIPGTTYYARIRLYKEQGNKRSYSEWSRVVSGKYVMKTTAFTGYTIKGNKATFRWNAVNSYCDGYQLQCSTKSNFHSDYTKTHTIESEDITSISVTGFLPNQVYYGRIRTYKIVNGKAYYSAWSSTKSAKYTMEKTALTGVVAKQDGMQLKWNAVTNYCDGYEVQYSTSSTFKSGNKTVTVSGCKNNSVILKNIIPGKTYYARIRTYKNVNGQKYYSAWSAVYSANYKMKSTSFTTATTKSTSVLQYRATVNWKRNSEYCDGYQIQYATNSSFKNATTITIKGSATTSKTITGLRKWTKYYGRIRCYKVVDGKTYYSAWSATKTGTYEG